MSDDQKKSPEKCGADKRTSDKGESSTPTQSPQKHYKHKRKRRNRASSSSSDGVVIEAQRDLRHMERLLLHSGKLHVFRTYFGDPTMEFYTRPEGRRRHPAGATNRKPPDEARAMAALGMLGAAAPENLDNDPLERPQVDEGPPSVISSRGLSSGSSFTSFPPSPPDYNPDFQLVPFEGLPPMGEDAAAARSHPKSNFPSEHDDYMASVSASDSDEPARRNLDPIQVADRLNRMVVSGSSPAMMSSPGSSLPAPEPMSLSSDPPTPRDSE